MPKSDARTYRTQVRQLLTAHFDIEELRMLCFDLKVDYDDLRGEGKTNKARELVAYLDRRGRIPELVGICSQQRPNVSWENELAAATSALSEPDYSDSASQGLIALAELMQSSQVRSAVVAFCTDFEAACEQIELLNDYKYLHDLLHELQFHCYNPIVQEARHFPDDDVAVDNLMEYEITLQRIVNDLRDIVERASIAATETLWIQDLAKAQQRLGQAAEELNAKLLKRAIWLLNRVLGVQPSQINTRLNASAKALRLPALVEAMTYVSDSLARFDLDPAKVEQFEAGVDALDSLNRSLTVLVQAHDKWQVIDLQLRRVEANIDQDMMELEMSWPGLKTLTDPMYGDSTDEWALSFKKDSEHLNNAIAAENPAQIKRYFRRYRRQASVRFHKVDMELKRLCQDLQKVGTPLISVMRVVE